SVFTIDSTAIMASTATTLSEVLQARVPGLSILRAGGVAAQGSQLLLRGPRSFFSPSDPIVIIDGIRVDALQDATAAAVGVSTSRLDDFAPEDIARIDGLPGAAAASLYGPGASGGALIITTKHAVGGPERWHARVQPRLGFVSASFPTNYFRPGVSPSTGQPVNPCFLAV